MPQAVEDETMLFRRQRSIQQHREAPCLRQSVVPIYAMLFAMQCACSMFIVLISWFALQITGEVASVGRVLICWQLLALTLGPLIGPLVDRFGRRTLFVIGETVHGAGVGLLALIAFAHSPEPTPIAFLYGTACLVSVGSLLSYPSSQALIQLAGGPVLMRTVSFGLFYVQVGNIIGAALGGLCLARSDVSGSLIICAAFSFAAAALAALLRLEERRIRPVMDSGHMPDLFKGILEIITKPPLALAAFALLLAYASAHASNALLAGFARYELKLSPDHYGWIAAMYSGGGLFGSVILAWFSQAVRERVLIATGTVFLAAATGGFSTAQTMSEAVFWQGLIGMSFMMIRAGGDVMVLTVVANRMVGRVRSNIDAGIGLTAIVIYLLPSLVPDLGVRIIYLGLAGLFAFGSAAIVWMQWSTATVGWRQPPRSMSRSRSPPRRDG